MINEPPPVAFDPLAAIPHRAPDVETIPGEGGHVHLRRPIPATGLIGRLLPAAWTRRWRSAVLDPVGAQFWQHIDAARTLRVIGEIIARDCGRDEADVRRAVLLYTRTLVQRHLIHLEIPGPK